LTISIFAYLFGSASPFLLPLLEEDIFSFSVVSDPFIQRTKNVTRSFAKNSNKSSRKNKNGLKLMSFSFIFTHCFLPSDRTYLLEQLQAHTFFLLRAFGPSSSFLFQLIKFLEVQYLQLPSVRQTICVYRVMLFKARFGLRWEGLHEHKRPSASSGETFLRFLDNMTRTKDQEKKEKKEKRRREEENDEEEEEWEEEKKHYASPNSIQLMFDHFMVTYERDVVVEEVYADFLNLMSSGELEEEEEEGKKDKKRMRLSQDDQARNLMHLRWRQQHS
jgi:hypothetical protein